MSNGIHRTERLTRIQIHDHTHRPLFPAATIRELGIGHEPYGLIERIVKSMACSRVLGKYHVFSRTTQSFHILSTPLDGHVVVAHAVKEPNGVVADALIIDILRVAPRIKDKRRCRRRTQYLQGPMMPTRAWRC